MQHVEMVEAMANVGEEATMVVPNLKYSSVDLHPRAAFVKLVKADGVAERQDVVDVVEHPVLASLGLEQDGADAADLHRGRIHELDEASNDAV